MLRVSFAAWGALALLACEGPIGEVTQPIIDGEPAPEAEGVVAVVERSAACAPEPLRLRCTGALVGPRAVLTAAHCLGVGAPSDLAVLFDGSLAGAGPVVRVLRGERHPAFDPESRAFDLAVLVLESDAPAAPVALGTVAADAVGSPVTMLGYGGISAEDSEGGERRQGSGRIDVVDPAELRLTADPAMSCRGDSGGPVLDEGGSLIAVTSRGDPACVEFALAARIDADSFLTEAVERSLLAPEAQRPFDPAEHFCEQTCASDADCPSGTHCIAPVGGTPRCVLPGLSPGELLGACDDPRACGEGPCVSTPAGCQCFQACGAHSHLDMGTGSTGDGGGCRVADGPPMGFLGVMVLVWLRTIRRRTSK